MSFASSCALNESRQPGEFDAIIVGAGVAGLFAADTLLERHPGASLLVVDAGYPLERRRELAQLHMGGYGGAGLYLGGRLYLGAAALPVEPPVSMPTLLRPVIRGEEYVRRAEGVDHLLHALGATAEWQQEPPQPLRQAIEQAAAVGLDYVTSYPSRRLSQDDKLVILGALRERLTTRGARFRFRARVTTAGRDGAGFALGVRAEDEPTDDNISQPAALHAKTVLLAPGRYGAEWLRDIAQSLDIETVAAPSTFGVRLEFPVAIYDRLTDVNPDPRLQRLAGDDALIKTYATCPGGVVAPVVRYGALVASGIPQLARERRGPSTTVAILAQPGVAGALSLWRGGDDSAALLNQREPGRLIVQRLGDVRRGLPTSTDALAANSVRPTDATAAPGALHDAYSSAYWRAFDDFVARIDQLAPGVNSDDTLTYGPAEERFWGYPTDELMQTSAPGVFVAGDGPGQSQGIIQASVAGVLAGEGMARALRSAAQ